MSLFQVNGLTKRFGGIAVADSISLSLKRGERAALIGPNGAGKTSFVNLASGYVPPDSGSIDLDGADITHLPPAKRVKAGLVRSFQITRLFPDMTAVEHVALAILQRQGQGQGLWPRRRLTEQIKTEASGILASLSLEHLAGIEAGKIAYGQQRLLEIALVLAMRPKVLLLDEPAAGVSASDTMLIEQALAQLPSDLAILMIEHDMDLVFRFARRVIVLAAGAVIFDGLPADAIADQRVREAYLGSYADARAPA